MHPAPSPTAPPSLRHIPPDSPEWDDPRTTCLSIGLDPIYSIQADVTCDKCKMFWEKKLCFDVGKNTNQKRTTRMICERPFDYSDSNNRSKYRYKGGIAYTLRSLFVEPGLVVSPATALVVTPSSRVVPTKSAIQSSGPSASKSSGTINKPKTNRGATKLFNDNGSMTVDLTNKLKVRLENNKNLEKHEIDLIHVLLNSCISDMKKNTTCPMTRKDLSANLLL